MYIYKHMHIFFLSFSFAVSTSFFFFTGPYPLLLRVSSYFLVDYFCELK